MIEVVAVNREARRMLLGTGELIPIVKMFDCLGDETEDPEEALAAVGPLPDGRWVSVDLRCYTGRPH